MVIQSIGLECWDVPLQCSAVVLVWSLLVDSIHIEVELTNWFFVVGEHAVANSSNMFELFKLKCFVNINILSQRHCEYSKIQRLKSLVCCHVVRRVEMSWHNCAHFAQGL